MRMLMDGAGREKTDGTSRDLGEFGGICENLLAKAQGHAARPKHLPLAAYFS